MTLEVILSGYAGFSPCPYHVPNRPALRLPGSLLKGSPMSRRCELSGKAVQVGHKVSHSNHKTKKRFLPNLCNVTLISDTLARSVSLRVTASALRSVEHRGGLDAYLLKARDSDLSPGALTLKRDIANKHAQAAA